MQKLNINSHRPLIIAGPCGAETEEQLFKTCTELASTGLVHALRVGVWKPRTSPESFAGSGSKGLRWVRKVSDHTGLPAAVEVATPTHVEKSLKYGIRVFWIGARTTVNPFSVQEIAEAIKGVEGLTILIKNPLNPDPDTWTGAIERLLKTGIPSMNVGMVHRGFSCFGSGKYRNAPLWHIIFEMRERFPGMTMLCDPSHIAGKRAFLKEISQTAADLCYDGLMIESHWKPETALCDSQQQLTPAEFEKLIRSLRWRSAGGENASFRAEVADLRRQIDRIDSDLLGMLAERMRVSDRIGLLKRDREIAILQDKRWRNVVAHAIMKGGELDLSEDFIRNLLETIHMESIRRQTEVMNKE